jgi:Trk K+ transport system NAD-binding subunit
MPGMEGAEWSGHVIVCGLRGLGLRIVEQLRHAGERVVVVDEESDLRLARVVIGWGVPHLTGSAVLPGTLREAGLAGAAAVVCVEGTDLRNLEISLLARELRPDVRVISSIANRAVGRALSVDDGPGAVLDVAALSAPSVVEACLRSAVHELDLGGVRFLAARVRAPESGTLRHLFGDLAPLAVTPADDGGEVLICPGRDQSVRLDDRIMVLGTPDELAARSIPTSDGAPSPGPRPVRRIRALPVLLEETSRGLRRALITLAVLIAVSTVVLRYGYSTPGMSFVDGLYFSVETVATVGFGDFSFAGQPTWLRLYAVLLMIFGVTATAVLFAFLTDLLVSRRAERSSGRRLVTGMSGHVVLAGLGTVGVGVLADLVGRGQQVVVIERDDDNRFLAEARALKVPVIFGDATQPATLRAANLTAASAVAVLTSDDMVNIETGLAVRDLLGERWRDVPVVLRVFDRSLARTISRRFGFHNVRSTAELAAPWFVGAALGLHVLSTFSAEQQSFLVGRFTVNAGGGLDGLTMQELSERTRVVAIARADGTLEHPPRRATRFAPGDHAYLVGPHEELLRVLRRGRQLPRV